MDACSPSARRPATSRRRTSSSTTAGSPRSARAPCPRRGDGGRDRHRSSCPASSTPIVTPGRRCSGTSARMRRAQTPRRRRRSPSEGYRPDDVYAATLIGLLGAAEAGITTVVDWSDIRPGRRLRGRRAPGPRRRRAARRRRPAGRPGGDRGCRARTRRLLARLGQGAGLDHHRRRVSRCRGDGCRPRSPTTGRWPGIRPADPRPRRLGARRDRRDLRCWPGGGSWVTTSRSCIAPSSEDADLDAIASSGASVSLAPSSELAGGLGIAPIQQLIDRDIRPGPRHR